jgi:hypothetical protein
VAPALPDVVHFHAFATAAKIASTIARMPLSPGCRATHSCSNFRSERAWCVSSLPNVLNSHFYCLIPSSGVKTTDMPTIRLFNREILRVGKMHLILLAMQTSAIISSAADKPTIYNHVNNESTAIDPLVNAALAPKYTIVDIRDDAGYAQPKFTAGHLPRTAKTEAGKPLGGYVLIAYVVSMEGRVASPVVLKTTDERLNSIATKAMEDWRFTPATLNETVIATTSAQEFNFETAPTEFVPQLLEPTGGKISRPKDWFYEESHSGPSYTWILSRENSSKGPYTTGVRIQTFVGVKEGAGKTAKEFVLDFAATKRKKADKVIKSCDPKDQGLFTRICLETEEGPYHILYSLFWGTNDMDVVVVSIAGTRKELWETYSPTFDKMAAFELIDMKRFEK